MEQEETSRDLPRYTFWIYGLIWLVCACALVLIRALLPAQPGTGALLGLLGGYFGTWMLAHVIGNYVETARLREHLLAHHPDHVDHTGFPELGSDGFTQANLVRRFPFLFGPIDFRDEKVAQYKSNLRLFYAVTFLWFLSSLPFIVIVSLDLPGVLLR